MISAVILTKNEEDNIQKCIKNLLWCDEIVVIDDFSTDKTVHIAKKLGAKVFKHSLDNDFAAQRNYALNQAKREWVLFIDADERVSKSLATEIIQEIKHTSVDGYFLKRKDFVFGKWLKHTEAGNIDLLRLAKKNSGKWLRRVHETWNIEGNTKNLDEPLLHYPHKNVAQFMKSINTYSTLHAQVLYEEGKKTGFYQILAYPAGKFFSNYFLRLGFLDGFPGIIHAMLMSFHSFLARAKLWLLH